MCEETPEQITPTSEATEETGTKKNDILSDLIDLLSNVDKGCSVANTRDNLTKSHHTYKTIQFRRVTNVCGLKKKDSSQPDIDK